MATVKELKATARPSSGKGAARAERRAGRVPGVIYGDNQPPVTISVEDAELRQRILAGRFLTTIYDIDLEGKKHRVIPRDFHLDPVRDFPIHVDFMRLGEGATIRVSVPLRIQNAESAPGVKRGGTVNIVTHTIDLECSVDNIPQFIEADVGALEISHSLHLSDIKMPTGVRSLSREDVTLVTIVPPSGYAEEIKAAAAAAAAGPAAAAAPGAAPAQEVPRLRRPARRRLPVATRRSNNARDAASCDSLLASAIPVRNTRITGTTSVSWPSMKLRGVMVSRHGAAAFRARPRKARSMASGWSCFVPRPS
jgi:large subunit ribosomal protein L25